VGPPIKKTIGQPSVREIDLKVRTNEIKLCLKKLIPANLFVIETGENELECISLLNSCGLIISRKKIYDPKDPKNQEKTIFLLLNLIFRALIYLKKVKYPRAGAKGQPRTEKVDSPLKVK